MLKKVKRHYNKKGYNLSTNLDTIIFCIEKTLDQVHKEQLEKEYKTIILIT